MCFCFVEWVDGVLLINGGGRGSLSDPSGIDKNLYILWPYISLL